MYDFFLWLHVRERDVQNYIELIICDLSQTLVTSIQKVWFLLDTWKISYKLNNLRHQQKGAVLLWTCTLLVSNHSTVESSATCQNLISKISGRMTPWHRIPTQTIKIKRCHGGRWVAFPAGARVDKFHKFLRGHKWKPRVSIAKSVR